MRGSDFVLTSPFARHRSPFTRELDLHAGIDLAAPGGTPIHAAADGLVRLRRAVSLAAAAPVWWRYGNLGASCANGDRFVTLYGHCETVAVRAGQTVRRGESLGTVGNYRLEPQPAPALRGPAAQRRTAGGSDRSPIYILDVRWPSEERLLAGQGPPRRLRPVQVGRAACRPRIVGRETNA